MYRYKIRNDESFTVILAQYVSTQRHDLNFIKIHTLLPFRRAYFVLNKKILLKNQYKIIYDVLFNRLRYMPDKFTNAADILN